MLKTTGLRNRWILFPIAVTFPGERIQKNWAGHSKLFITYMWICNINIGFMLWFHDLFSLNSVGGYSQWEISLLLIPVPMNGSHPSCQLWEETIGKLMEQSTSVRKTHTFWAAAHIYIQFKLLGHYRYRCNGFWAMIYGVVSGLL